MANDSPDLPRLFNPQRQLAAGDEIATCPSCSLIIRVVYDMVRRIIFFMPGGNVHCLTIRSELCYRWIMRITRVKMKVWRSVPWNE